MYGVEFDKGTDRVSFQPVVDELIFKSYRHNRMINPDIPASSWALIFSNAEQMEQRLIAEKN